MTGKEIIEKLKELGISNETLGYGDFGKRVNPIAKYGSEEYKTQHLDGIGQFIEVYEEGGEGEGSHWEKVYHFKDHDVYISMCGFYQSYDGVSFDAYEPEEVFPVQVTRTEYTSTKPE